MRVYLETLGCRLNYAEMAALGRDLAGAGHDVVDSARDADICVLNSCAVTGEAARKSRQLARQMARTNPAARLVVTGCYATLEGEAVGELPNVSLVVGNERKDEILSLLARGEPPAPTDAAVRAPSPESGMDRTRAFVKVQDGCRNRCSYCIVTLARGDERSRTVREVVAEVRALERAGFREAVLTGVHLGAYGRDRDESLAALVRALCDETAMPRLRLSSLEPFDLHPEFFRLWEESAGRLMPHLHLPAQSGSDPVLRRMARRNTVADFEALAAAAHASIPDLTLTTDLIAGFPGETEEEFERTVAFSRRMRFAHIHAFSFSPRPGTAAARMAGQLPGSIRSERAARLGTVSRELGAEVRRAFLGTVRPVLWESCEPDPKEPAATLWSGLTDNYLRVLARVPDSRDLHNKTLPVRLVRAEGEQMWGEWPSPWEGA